MSYSLAYESQASVPLTTDTLLELLASSREKNARLGVTGILLYRRGTFLQVLEGPRGRVDELYATIGRDPRHHGVRTVLGEDRRERRFPEWTMAFADVAGDLSGGSAGDLEDVEGYNDVLRSVTDPDGDGKDSPQFLELLTLFASED